MKEPGCSGLQYKKAKISIILCLCAALILLIAGIAAANHHAYIQQGENVFGKSYGNYVNLYANNFVSYIGNRPEYAISKQGQLYALGYNEKQDWVPQKMGRLIPFQITEENFDLCISGAGWTANIDAQYIREHTVSAWKCEAKNGWLYYFLLQENGDVFVAWGGYEPNIYISQIICLHSLGDDEVFHEFHKD